MKLVGKQFIGNRESSLGQKTFSGIDPATGQALAASFREGTAEEVDSALKLAHEAFAEFRRTAPSERAGFLRAIADGIEELGESLLERASAETALGLGRLQGERARTVGQIRMFANLIEDGSWVEARIDFADPNRTPAPKPDLRRMLIPLGPVAVFGASNFPLAFSVPGGDTASALAAGCPVVVKAHPAHPGTSEMVARVILKAAQLTGMPEGVFSLIQGRGHEVGLALVRHPLTQAVAFTGSLRAGRALFDAAAERPQPIPVYAEMGSANPVFVLPGAIADDAEEIANGLVQAMTLGAGQFCTNPGIVAGVDGGELEGFIAKTSKHVEEQQPATMLYPGICEAFHAGLQRAESSQGVTVVARSKTVAESGRSEAGPVLLSTDGEAFQANPALSEEIFGPATLVVKVRSKEALLDFARGLEGHLTATIHGSSEELEEYSELISILETKVGRILFNGFPTGVEVVPAMQHGGPYPATTDARTTSVGTAAIYRFARPICYQNFPEMALPPELRDGNPRGIWRLEDGKVTR